MNNFLANFKAENILNSLKNIFSRFTVSAILSIFTTIIFVLYNQQRILESLGFSYNKLNIFLEIGFSMIISFFLSVSLYIFAESLNFSKIKANFLQIFAILYGIFFFYFFGGNINFFNNLIFLIINIIGIFSFLFFAPYTKQIFCKSLEKTPKNQNFYSYFSAIFIIFILSFLVGFSVFVLFGIGFLTIEKLFDIYILSSKYIYIWLISALFIAPFFALNNIPKKETFENGKFNENNFGLFLIKYICIPAIFIYFIILYAYTIKVLINFNSWPKGEISWLVIGFSIFGYFIYLTSYIYEEKIIYIKKFRKYFPAIVFPQIFMLFYAIFLRINQYNLTTNRYLVVIFGTFLTIITIYFIFSKRKYLANIFSTIFIFCIISSVGPWSIYNLPEKIQTESLKTELKKVGILTDSGEIKPLSNEEKFKKETSEISKKIDYLCEYHDCKKLANFITNGNTKLLETIEKKESNRDLKFGEMDYWTIKYLLKTYINIYTNYYSYENKNTKTLYFNSDTELTKNIKGYDYLQRFNMSGLYIGKNRFFIDFEREILEFYDKDKYLKNNERKNVLEKIDLKETIKNIIENGKNHKDDFEKALEYEFETDKIKLKLVIEYFSLDIENNKLVKTKVEGNLGNNVYNRNFIEGYILYSIK